MQDFDIKNLIPVFVAVGIIILILLIAIPISKSTGQKYIKVVGNLFWLILVGWELAIIFGIVGVICCVTILFIPVGIQYFKFARLAFWPFGYKPDFTKLNGFKLALNIIWLILAGWEGAVIIFIAGALCCVTIIGIPAGLQLFKFARLVIMPLGTTIEKIQE